MHVRTSLVKMYAKCGNLEGAQNVLDKMVSENVVSGNITIGGYAESGVEKMRIGFFFKCS